MRIFASLLVVGLFFSSFIFIFAQTPDPSAVIQRRAELEAELAELEKEIEAYRGNILGKQQEATSLERDIAILDAQIGKAKLEIKARTIAITNIQNAIYGKNQLIADLLDTVEREKSSLGELLRRLYELDQTSVVELVLGYENFSDFFVDTYSFDVVQETIQKSFVELQSNKVQAEEEIDLLETRKAEELQLKTIQELEKGRIEEREGERQKILDITRGEEKAYAKLLEVTAKDAATIRSELFVLQGSPDISFERALELAIIAEKATGVRPAFLLGVIAEESNLGANVGTGNWREDLSHARCAKQRTAFVDITSRLGFDPDFMPVSRKAWYGYCGGAMGPAQFIPTTWLLYEDLVSEITGNNPANPWDPLDAFVASGLLLRDNGAAERTYAAERRAALRYLAGSNWAKPAYAFYGDDVMGLAVKYQSQIDILSRFASQ
jgi:hypothetical protein